MWAAEDPRSDRGLRVAGPGLRRCPVARVRWQDFLATWPAFPPTRNEAFPKTTRTSKAGPLGLEADQASRPFISLEARPASGTTVGVSDHG